MKNILLPTDFSENASKAISYALALFKNEKTNFFILNTYVPAILHSRFMAAAAKTEVIENCAEIASKNGLKETLNYIVKHHKNPNHSYTTISSFYVLTHEIVDIIKNKNIDLVVNGTKGITNSEGAYIGTNTLNILHSMQACPILSIPNNSIFQQPKQLLLATDLKRSLSAEALESILFLTTLNKCTIHIIHLKTNESLDTFQEANLQLLQNHLLGIPLHFHPIPVYASTSEIIGSFINEYAVDMLLLTFNNRSYLEVLLQEPIKRNFTDPTKVPLLVLPS